MAATHASAHCTLFFVHFSLYIFCCVAMFNPILLHATDAYHSAQAQEMVMSQGQRKDNTGFEGLNLLRDRASVTLQNLSLALLCFPPACGANSRLQLCYVWLLLTNCFHLQLSLVTANKICSGTE